MHELPIIKTIFEAVNEHAMKCEAKKVLSVNLQIGVLRELVPELLYKYWEYVSRGTIVEGSTLVLEEIPAAAKCSKCSGIYVIDYEHIEESKCPYCGHEKGYLISGREIMIDSIQIEND